MVRTDTEDKLWEALHANPNSTATDLSIVAKIGKSTAQKILVRWAGDGSVTRTAGIAEGGRRAADLWAITEGDAAPVDSAPVDSAPVDQDDAPADDADATDTTQADPDNPVTPNATDTDDATPAEDAPTEPATTEPTDPAADDDVQGTADTDATDPAQTKPVVAEETETANNGTATTDADTATDSDGGDKARLASGALRGMVEDYLRDHPSEQFGPTAIAKALGGKSSGAVSNICGSSDDHDASSNDSDWSEQDVADVLVALEADGRVVRVGSDDAGQWQVVKRRRTRLPQGGLQGLVEDFLAEHPSEAFGPHTIGTALGRSSGAVANALIRLTERGAAVQVSDRPRRYGAAAKE
jgi:hypothetical protein